MGIIFIKVQKSSSALTGQQSKKKYAVENQIKPLQCGKQRIVFPTMPMSVPSVAAVVKRPYPISGVSLSLWSREGPDALAQ